MISLLRHNFFGYGFFWPFTQQRMRGLRLLRSGDALPNVAAVWVTLMLTLWNLDRLSAAPQLDSIPFLLFIVLAPLLVTALAYIWQKQCLVPNYLPSEVQGQIDILADGEELQV